jgi:predicted phage terminase large subunit-like protein
VGSWIAKGHCKRVALIGQTQADVRDVMILGESGILASSPDKARPTYEPSKRLLTWPNGAIATAYSGDHYGQLRGPQFDGAWIDELAKFREPEATWDHLMLGLRLGIHPRVLVTTTPTPHPFIRKLVENPGCVVTRGSTFDNKENLPPSFLQSIQRQYEGTPLEAQEIYAQILDSNLHVLWKPEDFRYYDVLPPLVRVVVGVDPAASQSAHSDETGIIVAGADSHGRGYVLEDLSGRYSPQGWAAQAIQAYHRHQAYVVVAEKNNGGEMVESVLQLLDASVRVKGVWAKSNKYSRALPVAMLYQQKRIFHAPALKPLEHQLVHWSHKIDHDDRLDALVWALTELFIGPASGEILPPFVFHRGKDSPS